MMAYAALQRLQVRRPLARGAKPSSTALKDDLGYGLLLKKYTPNVVDATPEQIRAAVDDTIPNVAPIFWSFRIMVGLGFWFLFVFARRSISSRGAASRSNRWLLQARAVEHSAAVDRDRARLDRRRVRPPAVDDRRGAADVSCRCRRSRRRRCYFSLGGFIVFYTALLVVEIYLMLKYIRLGPSQPRHRALPLTRRREARDDLRSSTTRRSRSSGGCSSACCSSASRSLDGFDLGVGMLLPFVGRTDDERRVVLNSIGPTWEGNQVWFITAGGATFAAWPLVYATAFSGFYVALIADAVRAVPAAGRASTTAARSPDPRWRNAWDWGIFVGGLRAGAGVRRRVRQPAPRRAVSLRRRPCASFYTGSFFGAAEPVRAARGRGERRDADDARRASICSCAPRARCRARAMRAARVAGIVLIVLFAAAGFWIATGIDGYRIVVDAAGRLRVRAAREDRRAAARRAGSPTTRRYPWTIARAGRWPSAARLLALLAVGAGAGPRCALVLSLRRGRRRRADRRLRAVPVHHAVVERSRRAA